MVLHLDIGQYRFRRFFVVGVGRTVVRIGLLS